MLYKKYQNMQFCMQLCINIWEISLYLQASPYWLKSNNINSLSFINAVIKELMLMIFLFDRLSIYKKEKNDLLKIDVLLYRVIF